MDSNVASFFSRRLQGDFRRRACPPRTSRRLSLQAFNRLLFLFHAKYSITGLSYHILAVCQLIYAEKAAETSAFSSSPAIGTYTAGPYTYRCAGETAHGPGISAAPLPPPGERTRPAGPCQPTVGKFPASFPPPCRLPQVFPLFYAKTA